MPDTVQFKPVTTDAELEELAALAEKIWMGYWPQFLGEEQTRYMVDMFHSVEAMRRDMAEHGYEYWFIVDGSGRVLGYTGGHDEPETGRYYISKVYLLPEARGHHVASRTFDFFDALCRERGWRAMYLNVNKGNELGLRAYKGNGFAVIESVVNDIGHGFVMDDYVMERTIG